MPNRVATCSILMLFAAAAVAAAQTPAGGPVGGMAGGGGFGQRRMQRLLQSITLTAPQQAKVDSVTAKYRAQMPPFTPGTFPDSVTREKMRALFSNQDEEIRALLTPDQQKIWDQNVTAMRNRMQQRAPGDR
jgi:Spy/CpxP family protein refolding chaperone